MARTSRTSQYNQGFSQRLTTLMTILGQDIKSLSNKMGHTSTSTLRNAIVGIGGLDIEKLSILGQLKTAKGELPNLDWLLTGRGTPLLSNTKYSKDPWHDWLSIEKKNALKTLIEDPLPSNLRL